MGIKYVLSLKFTLKPSNIAVQMKFLCFRMPSTSQLLSVQYV